jgi:hypothetical protein
MGVVKVFSMTTAAAALSLLLVCVLSPDAYSALKTHAMTVVTEHVEEIPADLSESEWWAAAAQQHRAYLAASASQAWAATEGWREAGSHAWARVQTDVGARSAALWATTSETAANLWDATAERRAATAEQWAATAGRRQEVVEAATRAWDTARSFLIDTTDKVDPALLQGCMIGLPILLGMLLSLRFASRRRQRRATRAATIPEASCPASVETVTSAEPRAFFQRRSRVASPPPRPAAAERSTERAPLSDISTQIAGETFTPNQPITESDVLAILNSEDPSKLKGIGPICAARIIKFRESEGDINKIDDLVSKVGMTRGLLVALKRQQGIQ